MAKKSQYNEATPTVREHHSFFWNTKLSEERMEAISSWVGSLSLEQKSMLKDLLADNEDEVLFDER